MAAEQGGAETINFDQEDVFERLKRDDWRDWA